MMIVIFISLSVAIRIGFFCCSPLLSDERAFRKERRRKIRHWKACSSMMSHHRTTSFIAWKSNPIKRWTFLAVELDDAGPVVQRARSSELYANIESPKNCLLLLLFAFQPKAISGARDAAVTFRQNRLRSSGTRPEFGALHLMVIWSIKLIVYYDFQRLSAMKCSFQPFENSLLRPSCGSILWFISSNKSRWPTLHT